MTKVAVVLAVALVTTPLAIQDVASTPTVPDLTGRYTVTGTTRQQGTYQGEAVIQQRGRAVFVVWQMANGRQLAGLGLITGSSLAASYALDNGIGAVAVYQIDGTKLVGEWPDGDSIQRETLTRAGERAAE